ncbi:MAG: NADH-quinone oxidoreductase subunit NuoE [Candidatus Fermentibacteraceae bacterium]
MARSAEQIVEEGLSRYGSGREAVMQLLTDVNNELGYVPEEAMRAIAKAVGVSNAEIYSVVSFYSFLSIEPRGRHIVRLCKTISCAMKGSADILDALRGELGIGVGETTEDGRVTLETTSCIGLCDQSPAMLVNDVPHSRLTPEKACEIVRGLE